MNWADIFIAAVSLVGMIAAFIHRETIIGWFRRSAGPAALAETLKTIEALEGRVNFVSGEVARLKEENALLRRENDQLREMVTSRGAISELTAITERTALAIEKLAEASQLQHESVMETLLGAKS